MSNRYYDEPPKKSAKGAVILLIILLVLIALCIVALKVVPVRNDSSGAQVQAGQTAEAQNGSSDDTAGADDTAQADETESETTKAAVTNDKPVNLYRVDYGTMTCTKVTSDTSAWTPEADIGSFGAFCTTVDSFPFTSEMASYHEYWDAVNTATEYKIGYELSFDLNGQTQTVTILKPADITDSSYLYMGDFPEDGDYSAVTGYMGVWVYDDYNQTEGVSYSHITQDQMTDDSLLTSIKLRPTPLSGEISNFTLKSFSYSSDDEFDSEGHYAGDYASEINFVDSEV